MQMIPILPDLLKRGSQGFVEVALEVLSEVMASNVEMTAMIHERISQLDTGISHGSLSL